MNRKKMTALLSCFFGISILLSGCSGKSTGAVGATLDAEEENTLRVVTTYGGQDGNASLFQEAVLSFEEESGITVQDDSETADEVYKNRILTDFRTGQEPDVLFFFTGADADEFIRAGRVVPIERIREDYPEYAENYEMSRVPASPADGVQYALPVNGYWEALFCNRDALRRAGLSVPDEHTTWTEFLGMCRALREDGTTPIAAALGDIPHYWWEYAIFNEQTPDEHRKIPSGIDDELAAEWVAGINDLKAVYDAGYFPSNTLSSSNQEAVAMFCSGQAAFLLDGSWQMPMLLAAMDSPTDDTFAVTYVPGTKKRKTTDLISGLSMGYYITKKAYDDDARRDAAVRFIEYMTSDEMVSKFASYSSTALKSGKSVKTESAYPLVRDMQHMLSGAGSFTPALQDSFNGACREPTFDGMSQILSGRVDAREAVEKSLAIYYSDADAQSAAP